MQQGPLSPEALERTDRYHVRSYECGPDGALQLHRLLDYLQETASLHAQSLDFAFPALPDGRRGAWVLAQIRVETLAMPKWNDEVLVTTFFHDTTPLFGHRDFRIHLPSGETCAHAATRWALIDPETRRMVRIPESVRSLGDSPRPLRFGPVAETFSKLRPPAAPAGPETVSEHRVMRAQIDLNGHVNNVHYADWMLESLPPGATDGLRLREIEIAYRTETLYGETVVSRTVPAAPGAFFHRVSAPDGRDHVAGTTRWA